MLSLIAILLSAAVAAPGEATVRPLEGESRSGRLAALSAQSVTLDASGGPLTLASAEVMWIDLRPTAPTEKPTTWIELLDGSRLAAVRYVAAEGKAEVTLTTGDTAFLPTRSIRTVRFRPPTPELAGQWRELTASLATGDMLIIRKTSTRTVEQPDSEPTTVTEQALDQLEGTIHAVGPDSVQFEYDGERVDVRREKLEGIAYFQPAKREFAAPVCRLLDAGGTGWLLRDLALSDSRLTGTTVGNVPLDVALAAVTKIDFSVGNVAFLADLEADSGGGGATVSMQPAGMTYSFSRVFQARPGPPLGADGFRIGGQAFESGLSLHSPARLVYRVPEGFRRFRAVVGVDDSVLAPGRFDLVILADGQERLRKAYASEQGREATAVDLDLAGVRRLTIVLDPADGQDIGDQLNLCEARFTK